MKLEIAPEFGSGGFTPAFAAYSEFGYYEGVVALHDLVNQNSCFLLLATEDHICTSKFDLISYCSPYTLTNRLKVLDM
jgi:hypothetical protein